MKRPVLWSRDALDEIKSAVAHIAKDNPSAARTVATAIREVGEKLGAHATGRIGRVSGTYEKSVAGAPYILAYAIAIVEEQEAIVILRVIHTARDWKPEDWPDR